MRSIAHFFQGSGLEKWGEDIKIWTKTGGRGKVSLFSGERVFKNTARVEADGDVDELNSVLGGPAASLPKEEQDLLDKLKQIFLRV